MFFCRVNNDGYSISTLQENVTYPSDSQTQSLFKWLVVSFLAGFKRERKFSFAVPSKWAQVYLSTEIRIVGEYAVFSEEQWSN
jgi:hypothetical protein